LADEILQITRGDFRTKVRGNGTAINDPVTLALAGNKPAVYRLLAEEGLPVPRHAMFSLDRMEPARQFLRQTAGTCVVKPARNTGAGQGVTTGVTTQRQLRRAAAAAAVYDRELIVEEQVAGANYRLLYLDGVLLDAVLRRPPAVVGDGRQTIRQLVVRANAQRLAGGLAVAQTLLAADDEMRRTLARQGLSLRSVLPAGQRVVVKTVINENAAAENEAATDLICPSVVSDGARAAACLGVRLAGLDVITEDPSQPLTESGGVILEVNTTPGFYYHYHRRGEIYPVALHVLHWLDKHAPVAPEEIASC
jgi:cyanophycin synthetase